MHTSITIFGLAVASADVATDTFELGRIQSPLDWILPVGVFMALAAFAILMYRRDCRELGGRPAILLSSLRLFALLGLLAIWLQPQWRARRDMVDRSRVILLVDTSQSMDRRDMAGDSPGKSKRNEGRSRSEVMMDELTSGSLLPQLRRLHDVLVYGFDEGEKPSLLATLPYLGPEEGKPAAATDSQVAQPTNAAVGRFQRELVLTGVLGAVGLMLIGTYLFRPKARGVPPLWLVLTGTVCALGAIGWGTWTLRSPNCPTMLTLLGLRDSQPVPNPGSAHSAAEITQRPPDWHELLSPRGTETRLGQAIYHLAVDERSAPVAGIIVLSDGGQNAGMSISDAAAAALESRIAIQTVGLGSRQETRAARWIGFDAHDRALPGDPFEVKARLRAVGLAGRSVTARLRQVPLTDTAGQPPAPDIAYDQQQEVLIGGPAEDLAIKFEVPGIKVAGRYGFELSLEGRGASAEPADSQRRFQIEVVDRKTKVLLIAGGPGREFRFLRGMLRRDKRIELTTWLQSSAVEQSKDDYPRILTDFPETKDKLYDYDCVVALDPDWTAITETQAGLLASWVAEQAGGLIVVPGRVYAGSSVQNWLADPKLAKIRALYPVEFPPVLFQADDVGRKWTQVRPVDLTREGIEADFLRLADNPVDSQRVWTSQFDGVYATLPVRGAKPGAAVYARHIDPQAEAAGIDPVFLAEQFFGAGRVFYVGSGELWRLRQVDEGHFERFYAQLIDHVSKQRLQRGARRGGILLLERNEYHVGDHVPLAADLKNVRDEPLDAPHVTLYVQSPESREPLAVKLLRDKSRKGMFVGQFVAKREGDYRLELPLPEGDDAPLVKVVKVTPSARESDNPQRNDVLLGQLARETGGRYYVGLDAALGRESETPMVSLLKDRTQITPVMGDKNLNWDAFWTRLAMFGVCGALAMEWLLRRLLRLA